MSDKLIRKTSIGGQALIEGIMMRGPEKMACAYLKSDKSIEVEVKNSVLPGKKYKILGLPLIRGVANMLYSLASGMKCLTDSATKAEDFVEEEPSKFDKWLESKLKPETLEKGMIGISMVFGIILPIFYVHFPAKLPDKLPSSLHPPPHSSEPDRRCHQNGDLYSVPVEHLPHEGDAAGLRLPRSGA